MTMHSEAAPQSVHSSCCTKGTARLPVGKPSFLSAGKPSTMFLLVAMGGESLWGDGDVGREPEGGQWALAASRRGRQSGRYFCRPGSSVTRNGLDWIL